MLALSPTVLDRQVLALDVTGFFQALLEGNHNGILDLSQLCAEPPDHRHRGLLRAGRERPSRCTAEKRDELATL